MTTVQSTVLYVSVLSPGAGKGSSSFVWLPLECDSLLVYRVGLQEPTPLRPSVGHKTFVLTLVTRQTTDVNIINRLYSIC